MEYKIYTLHDPDTLEIRYVGYTNQPFYKRLSSHICEAKGSSNTHKSNWIKGLLSDNKRPLIKLLDITTDIKELKKLEIYWINKLKIEGINLTNGTPGGDGLPVGFKHSELTKAKMSEAKSGKRPGWMDSSEANSIRIKIGITQTGKKLTKEHIDKIILGNTGKRWKLTELSKTKRYKPVIQYSLNGELLKIWTSIKEIEDTLNIPRSIISRCCNCIKGAYTGYGFIWKFKNHESKFKDLAPSTLGKKIVLQYTLNGIFIKKWESLTQINKELNFHISLISKCCNNKKSEAHGFIWKFETDNTLK